MAVQRTAHRARSASRPGSSTRAAPWSLWSISLIGVAALAAAHTGCGPSRPPLRLEDWIRVGGVDVQSEAEAVARTLEEAGFEVVDRVESEDVVALGFAREDGRRAVRVVTSRGVAVALDSHESDGVRVRHGDVRLVSPTGSDDAGPSPDAGLDLDLDRDGRPEIVVAREQDGLRCLALLRIAADGSAALVPTDAEELAPGACPADLADVDDDGAREVLVELRWPDLALPGAPAPLVRAALVAHEGAFRAERMPVAYVERERGSRLAALERARVQLDVASAARLAVELAALAHLTGASIAAQVEGFDRALAGLVLTQVQALQLSRIRAVIGGGWTTERPTPADPSTRSTPADPSTRPTPTDPSARPTPSTRPIPADPSARPAPTDPSARPTPADPSTRPTPTDPSARPTPSTRPIPADSSIRPTPADPSTRPTPAGPAGPAAPAAAPHG